jgi:hypothetical protein
MATAATSDGAIHTQEAGEAQARALDAITIVRTFIWAEHLACQTTIANITMALAILKTSPTAIAIIRANFGRNSSESHAFIIWLYRWWSLYQCEWLHLHADA